MTTDPGGELCGCGKRGCWETQVGPRSVLRRVRHTLAQGAPSQLNELAQGHFETITFERVVQAAHQQDMVARRALEDVGDALGLGVVNLINIFNPQLIVLGGALNLASQFLLPKVEEIVNRSALWPARENLRVAASAHGADACVMGAIALVLDDILREPIP
jgi:predicted NBD/HSP70 family sugar kinase